MNTYHTQDEHDRQVLGQIVDAVRDALDENNIQRVIGPSIRRMVMSQSYILLDKQLDNPERRLNPKPLAYDAPTADGLIREFDTSISHVQSVVANSIRLRVLDIVRREVHEVYQEALSNTPELPKSPPRGGGGSGVPERRESNGHHEGRHDQSRLEVMAAPDRRPEDRVAAVPAPAAAPAAPNPEHEAAIDRMLQELLERDRSEPQDDSGVTAEHEQEWTTTAGEPKPALQVLDGDDEVYEGTVRLSVAPSGGMQQVLQFVDALRRQPEFRLLQLVGSRKEGVDIWLGLREPLVLKQALRGIDGVSNVTPLAAATDDARDAGERILSVQLLEQTA